MIYLFFAILGFLGPGFGGQGFGLFSDQPWFLDDLDLPPEIMEQVQNLHFQHKQRMIDLQADLQKQVLNFQQILLREDLTEKEFLSEIDKVSELKKNLIKEKALFFFNLKKILPPEKWNILKERIFEIRKGGKFGKRQGRDFDEDFPRRNFRR